MVPPATIASARTSEQRRCPAAPLPSQTGAGTLSKEAKRAPVGNRCAGGPAPSAAPRKTCGAKRRCRAENDRTPIRRCRSSSRRACTWAEAWRDNATTRLWRKWRSMHHSTNACQSSGGGPDSAASASGSPLRGRRSRTSMAPVRCRTGPSCTKHCKVCVGMQRGYQEECGGCQQNAGTRRRSPQRNQHPNAWPDGGVPAAQDRVVHLGVDAKFEEWYAEQRPVGQVELRRSANTLHA